MLKGAFGGGFGSGVGVGGGGSSSVVTGFLNFPSDSLSSPAWPYV